MKKTTIFPLFCIFFVVLKSYATIFPVTTQAEFDDADRVAVAGDIIEWANGTYSDVYMDVDANGITVRAETPGGVIFNGTSRAVIDGSDVTFTGFQYIGGNILIEGSTSTFDQTILTIDGSNNTISQLNFSGYTCWKYMRIRDSSQYTNVTYCNFENRVNYADQNIFQIDATDVQPGFHNINHCSFKNFTGDPVNETNGDDGVEPIRTGSSSQAQYSLRTTIEHCYFTSCNGDDEIISGKASDCVYRYNTLEGNNGEIVLRHGNRGIVYGNFFFNNETGVRVREGSDHIIYNNYFNGLTDRSIDLQSSEGDLRVQNVIIANNTFVDTQRVELGDGDEINDPLNTVLINNIFEGSTTSAYLRDAPNTADNTVALYGNIALDSDPFGIDATTDDQVYTYSDAQLAMNAEGFYQLTDDSTLSINASTTNTDIYPFPVVEGLDYDNTVALDLLSNARNGVKDLGAQEYNGDAIVKPYASDENTGPSYLMPGSGQVADALSANEFEAFEAVGGSNDLEIEANIDWAITTDADWITLGVTSGSDDDIVEITADTNTGEARSAAVTITGGDLTVTINIAQAAAEEEEEEEIVIVQEADFIVTTQEEFDDADNAAVAGNVIEWANGTYSDIYMDVDANGVTVRAETPGGVIFNGASRAVIDGSDVTFTGFQYLDGNILDETLGTVENTIVTVDGSNNTLSQLNFSGYTCWKYMRIRDSSQYTNVTYCNFENRINYADQNIFQIDATDEQPGFHNVSFCSFKNFTGDPVNETNGDDGVEPIRTGSSSQSDYSLRTTIEYCYFSSCNGDDEVISGKASDCLYRYNTLEGNNGEIVLRHGNRGIVYGNFFFNNETGVRVREGSDHIIYNNYFNGLTDRSIDLQSSEGDLRVQNVIIANNTFVDTQRVELGDGDAINDPLNTVIINNIFEGTNSSSYLRDAPNTTDNTVTLYGNIALDSDAFGIDETTDDQVYMYSDEQLAMNANGFYQLTDASTTSINPTKDNADGIPVSFPVVEGLDYDNTIALDLLSNTRDTLKDTGAQEYSTTAQVIAHVNEQNTGPIYLMPGNEPIVIDALSANAFEAFEAVGGSNDLEVEANVDWTITTDADWITIGTTSGSGDDIIEVTAETNTGEARSAILTITGGDITVTVDVTQAANEEEEIVIVQEADFIVTSQAEFDAADNAAVAGNVIEWANGTYSDIYMDVDANGVTVRAETPGGVIFNGTSRAVIDGSDVTFTGFQYLDGNILDETLGTVENTIVTVDGSNNTLSQLNFSGYTCWKYMRIRDSSQYTNVTYCNFENRINYADQNIFQIDATDVQPGFHKVSHCSFKNFTGDTVNETNGDDGVEPIRTGSSSQSDYSLRTIIEYCYFTSCNGDDEVISGKASDCVYRYNTLEGNNGEIVLRHGNRGIVYGNFFFNNETGVRVREGSDHIIYNNYFSGLTDRSIDLQSSEGDLRVQNVVIANNTFVDTQRVELGDGDEINDPLNTVLINNIFEGSTTSAYLRDAPSTADNSVTLYGNIAYDSDPFGIDDTTDDQVYLYSEEQLELNANGFYQLTEASTTSIDPVIENADVNPIFFPVIEGLDYDNTISLDLLINNRDALKDTGAQEYSPTAQVIAHANEENTGPSYLMPGNEEVLIELSATNFLQFDANGGTDVIEIESNTEWTITTDSDWISLDTTSGSDNATISTTASANTDDEQRSASITITSEFLTAIVHVSQEAKQPDFITFNEADFDEFDADGGTNVLSVLSNLDWRVTVDASGSWISIDNDSGSSDGTINITAEENTTFHERSTTLTFFAGDLIVFFQVTQAAGDQLAVLEFPTFEATTSTNVLNVVSNIEWTATVDSDWLTLATTTGTGNGNIDVTVQENPLAEERTALITLTGADISLTVDVVQAAAYNNGYFIPDTNKTYYIDIPQHDYRLGVDGNNDEPYITSTNTVGPNVEWQFVANGNGSWYIQKVSAVNNARLTSAVNNSDANMESISFDGSAAYYDFAPGALENTYFITLPDSNEDYQRLQVHRNSAILFVDDSHNGTWESFRFTEADTALTNGYFVPDTTKKYYIDIPEHDLRLGANGNDDAPYTTSTNATGADVEWQFVAEENGSWHIQRVAGGNNARLIAGNNADVNMESIFFDGSSTYYDFAPGALDDTYFITLPDHTEDDRRLQVHRNSRIGINLVETSSDGTWESFRFIEVDETSAKSLAETIAGDDISIYPTPAETVVTITNAANSMVYIYDMNGRLVITKNVITDSEIIDLDSLAAGMYHAQIMNAKYITMKKIIKK